MSKLLRATLLALLPFLPLMAAVATHVPPDDSRIVALSGSWRVLDESGREHGATVVPGRFTHPGRIAILRRVVTLDDANISDRPVIIFGGAAQMIAEVVVNGHRVGSEGVPERRYKLAPLALNLYEVEPGILRAGENTIDVRLWADSEAMSTIGGIVEHRLYLGPAEVLRPYHDRTNVLERFFELGGAFYLLLAIGLILVVSRLETDPTDRREQRWVVGVAASVAAYLLGKSGLSEALHLPDMLVPWSITFLAMTVPAFLQLHILRRTNWLHRVNVVICMLHLTLQLFMPADAVYRAFIPYLFAVILACFALTLWDFIRAFPNRSPILLASVTCLVFAGVNDLLTDLGILATPRLFSLAAADMAVLTTLVIAGSFLRTLRENTDLLATLAERNTSLTSALDRAEESTRLKSTFLANTSHELRTPLNSIINVPEGLLEEFARRSFVVCGACEAVFDASADFHLDTTALCPECARTGQLREESRWVFVGEPDAAVRYLKSIQHSGRHLLAVVNDILDFSKLEAGRMELHFEPTPVADVLNKLDLTMRPLAEQRNIDFVVTPPASPHDVETDPLKLVQILMNLTSNALKFSDEGKRVDVRAAVAADSLRIEVQDRGIGIALADREKVFESFLQLDSGHTRRFSGTGLGLAITKKLVEQMGGRVELASTLGEGSTFTVVLPLRRR